MPPKKNSKKETVSWLLNGRPMSESPEGYEGFIYVIYNETKGGMYYIGRKSFYSYSKKKLTAAEKKLPENKRKTFKITKTKTAWERYTGSCDELNKHIKEGDVIRKEVLRLCRTRKQMTAWETKYILCDCILDDNCYNNHALGKLFKADFQD